MRLLSTEQVLAVFARSLIYLLVSVLCTQKGLMSIKLYIQFLKGTSLYASIIKAIKTSVKSYLTICVVNVASPRFYKF